MARPTQTTGSKTCTKCGVTKEITEFYKRGGKQSPNTRHNHCKECTKMRVSATPSIVKREQALKRMYGITQTDYEVMIAEQNNKCAICNTTEPGNDCKDEPGTFLWCMQCEGTTEANCRENGEFQMCPVDSAVNYYNHEFVSIA